LALERYLKEIEQVTSVLDGHLKKQKERYGGKPWLVRDRVTYADISFVTYQYLVPSITLKEELKLYGLDKYTEVNG
jgi:glutathione S-transferase